jgi:hypothetical protein
MVEFVAFPKIARLSREVILTEKIDGTNAAIHIASGIFLDALVTVGVGCDFQSAVSIYAQSRSRIITLENDNFGFARWVKERAVELSNLGEGIHFGEFWGSGIQRGYGLPKGEKRFSLFNTGRWKPVVPNYTGEPQVSSANTAPACCGVVPVLYKGIFDQALINGVMTTLQNHGSYATPFMNPEGIMIYHTAASVYFKKTFEGDAAGKEAA